MLQAINLKAPEGDIGLVTGQCPGFSGLQSRLRVGERETGERCHRHNYQIHTLLINLGCCGCGRTELPKKKLGRRRRERFKLKWANLRYWHVRLQSAGQKRRRWFWQSVMAHAAEHKGKHPSSLRNPLMLTGVHARQQSQLTSLFESLRHWDAEIWPKTREKFCSEGASTAAPWKQLRQW